MAKEIERKFLVLDTAWRSMVSGSSVFRQAYIVAMEGRSVRVRIIDQARAVLTVKIGASTFQREEFEYEIPLSDAEEMVSLAIGTVLEKTRYEVNCEGYTWEIDVYDGAYRGLVVAEVELSDKAEQPPLPSWLGPEVTGDRRYSNQTLAMEDLREELVNAISHPA
ncbi:CYTH domain-containing protein [Rhizobiaceae bacterium n13]|uniref:CYTH domain-containing protein n=1 Tax=Ferirhizobium litorale TaxID=2927786 RepID=A0AAE3Q992_9HYPH|nr:CYTH domain-containing protein [Fererhizobium litorale]MDI7860446.1 CYTH domain-containing protein [Fererhizobium litorale]MDI7920581.1 CYTH domain-containing protein [Fererhizobium litorale]